jgi:hypothetical protein
MRNANRLARARILNVFGLTLAAAGMLTQIFSGPDLFPTIPPGPIILLASAALIAFSPWRWTSIVAVVAPGFLLVGGLIATISNGDFADQLTDSYNAGIFLGSAGQVIGVVIAFSAGLVAAWDAYHQAATRSSAGLVGARSAL